MDGFSLTRKFKTFLNVLNGQGAGAVWSLLIENLNAAIRTMPGGLVRIGAMVFRPSDDPTRRLLLSGTYELDERRMAKRYIRPDIAVVEFGGSLGVVSCAVNRRMTAPKNHVVVEANPEVIPILTENRNRNRCQFEIVHGAVGARGSSVRIYIGADTLCSSVLTATERHVDVAALSLTDILDTRGLDHCAVVCDIEGSEINLIHDELPTFQSRVEVLIVEMHPAISGVEAVENACRILHENGFQQHWRQANTYSFVNTTLTGR